MGINKYNSEGYYDPTVYEALSNIEKEEKAARRIYRPLVYICSPYAGNVEQNVNMGKGVQPVCCKKHLHSAGSSSALSAVHG